MNVVYEDMSRQYGECILYWMLENAVNGRQVDDYEMQEGSGLPDFEFRLGVEWLIKNRLLDRQEDKLH